MMEGAFDGRKWTGTWGGKHPLCYERSKRRVRQKRASDPRAPKDGYYDGGFGIYRDGELHEIHETDLFLRFTDDDPASGKFHVQGGGECAFGRFKHTGSFDGKRICLLREYLPEKRRAGGAPTDDPIPVTPPPSPSPPPAPKLQEVKYGERRKAFLDFGRVSSYSHTRAHNYLVERGYGGSDEDECEFDFKAIDDETMRGLIRMLSTMPKKHA
jgi:hypothetical protein